MKGDQSLHAEVCQPLLWFTPSADGWSMCRDESWGKTSTFKLSSAQLGYWFPAQHSTLQPGKHWGVTLKQREFCGPSGQPGVLCIILQGCAAGKALTVEAADYLDVN